jgi:hypothetical protein
MIMKILVIAGLLVLTGCGASPGCRVVSTGLLGAGTGAALGAIAGNAGLGAAIGGAAGIIGGSSSAYLGPSPLCY